VWFGILQRYVIGEVLRAFLLALLTITAIFVLFMVMAEAAKKGLTPRDMAQLIPFIIPTTLPYTVPVALLFAVTVFYSRMAADNEIIAIKTAGLSAWTVLIPTLVLGAAVSVLLHVAARDWIPRANHYAMKILLGNMEDLFYKQLKAFHKFDNHLWPFFIRAKDVEGRTMIDATFKHRAGKPGNPNSFDLTVFARRASIRFEIRRPPQRSVARIWLKDSETIGSTSHPDVVLIDGKYLEYPIPDASRFSMPTRIQEYTYEEMIQKQIELQDQIARERKVQAVRAGMMIASGRLDHVDWPRVNAAFSDYQRWEREFNALETEKHMRAALAWGALFFVCLGAPVGIRFARRDFLSAFITCFVPIIGIYYPLTLLGINLGKEGLIRPWFALWMGNAFLGFLAGLFLRPIMKH
jgi:lipopolysaccharide export system permease protein